MSASEPVDRAPITPAPVTEVASLILFAADVERTAAFYRALGLALEPERHGDGPVHHTVALGPTHVAIFGAHDDRAGAAGGIPHRSAGAQFFGLTVPDLDAAFTAATGLGAVVEQEPSTKPWGRRALVRDPDGRVVELFERPA